MFDLGSYDPWLAYNPEWTLPFPSFVLKNLRPTPSGNAEDLEGGGARAMSMQQGAFLSVFREHLVGDEDSRMA